MRGLLITMGLTLLTACAQRPDCDAQALADAAVEAGQSLDELQRRHPGCDGLAEAYVAASVADCDPALAWRGITQGLSLPDQCPGQQDWSEAVTLATALRGFEEELATVESRLQDSAGDSDTGRLRMEQVRLIREADQLRGIAALRGWTAPGADQGRQKQ